MMDLDFRFTAKLWVYPGKAAWFLVTLPKDIGEQIKFFHGAHKGFGSVEIKAYLGGSEWKTSLFPDKSSGSYILPIKAEIRKAEGLEADDDLDLRIVVIT